MYKKFVIIVVSSILISLTLFLYIVIKHKEIFMGRDYPFRQFILDTAEKSNLNYKVVVLGDSRSEAGFIPNNIDIPSINLSMSGATPIEGYYVLKRYLKHNSIEKLILSYGPFHLASQDAYWEMTVKFQLFKEAEYIEVEQKSEELEEDKKTLGIQRTYSDYDNPFKYAKDFISGIRLLRFMKYNKLIKEITETRGHVYQGKNEFSNGLNQEANQLTFRPSPLIDYYLRELVELAQKNKIKIYYFTMPFNRSSFAATSDAYKKEYTQYLGSLGVNVCTDIFSLDNKNFGDSSHIFRGASKTTKMLYKCISK